MLHRFRRVVFFTGAGMSAECGIPTYRGPGGTWQEYRWEEYACQAAFDTDPERVWEFHQAQRKLAQDCTPHPGYYQIAAWQQQRPDIAIITQNIDGMHQASGSTNVLELHGSLWSVRCEVCGVSQEHREVPISELRHSCGRFWRPDLVWFGDCLDRGNLAAARHSVRNSDLLVVVGTSGIVYPAAQLVVEARSFGAYVVEINTETTNLTSSCDESLRGAASEILSNWVV